MGLGKRAFYEEVDLDEAAAYEHATRTMAANAVLPDAQEGMTVFLDKRTPRWRST